MIFSYWVRFANQRWLCQAVKTPIIIEDLSIDRLRSLALDQLDQLDLSTPPLQTTLTRNPTMAITSFPSPTPEDTEELLLIARYGELDELKSFIEKFGTKPLADARDEDGNTVLHMVCGNGHLGASRGPISSSISLYYSSVHLRTRFWF